MVIVGAAFADGAGVGVPDRACERAETGSADTPTAVARLPSACRRSMDELLLRVIGGVSSGLFVSFVIRFVGLCRTVKGEEGGFSTTQIFAAGLENHAIARAAAPGSGVWHGLLVRAFIPVPGFHVSVAGVAELVDAPDLGSGDESRGGSSPFARTSAAEPRFMCEQVRGGSFC